MLAGQRGCLDQRFRTRYPPPSRKTPRVAVISQARGHRGCHRHNCSRRLASVFGAAGVSKDREHIRGVSAHAPSLPLLLQPASHGLIRHVTETGRWFAALQTKQARQAERIRPELTWPAIGGRSCRSAPGLAKRRRLRNLPDRAKY